MLPNNALATQYERKPNFIEILKISPKALIFNSLTQYQKFYLELHQKTEVYGVFKVSVMRAALIMNRVHTFQILGI